MADLVGGLQPDGSFKRVREPKTWHDMDRNYFKNHIFWKVYFGQTPKDEAIARGTAKKVQAYLAIKELRPDLMAYMDWVKGPHVDIPWRDRGKKWKYKECPVFAQKLEVEIMRRIIKRIRKEYPTLWLITLHDCVLTTVGTTNGIDNQEIVLNAMREVWLELGIDVVVTPVSYAKVEPRRTITKDEQQHAILANAN
jgi:hypothetical protein